MLLLPVTEQREGAVRDDFEPRPERLVLPRHELVGGIAIMQDHDPAGAAKILASRPSVHTVLCAAGVVSGEYRTREFEVLAGIPTTRTDVIEYGHRFIVDLSTAYFSARLSSERQRILSRMGDNETVLDMFAGVGPFAITLAERAALRCRFRYQPGCNSPDAGKSGTEPYKERSPRSCRCASSPVEYSIPVRPDRHESPDVRYCSSFPMHSGSANPAG